MFPVNSCQTCGACCAHYGLPPLLVDQPPTPFLPENPDSPQKAS